MLARPPLALRALRAFATRFVAGGGLADALVDRVEHLAEAVAQVGKRFADLIADAEFGDQVGLEIPKLVGNGHLHGLQAADGAGNLLELVGLLLFVGRLVKLGETGNQVAELLDERIGAFDKVRDVRRGFFCFLAGVHEG
jgi:hypothetical protein